MSTFAALDVSQETTAVCVVDDTGRVVVERKMATCPEVISSFLTQHAPGLDRVGMETGPMAVWLWNELHDRGLPIVCIDARHANAALKVRPNKTDRNDAAGLAQIIRIGWFKQVRIKSRVSYELRSLLAAREVLVRSRVKIENEIRGLLRTFGVLIGKAAGGFANRTDQIVAGELDASPMMRTVISSSRKGPSGAAGEDQRPRSTGPCRRPSGHNRSPVHVSSRCRADHCSVGGIGIRRCHPLQTILQRRRVSRLDPKAIRIRRDEPEWADLQAWEQNDAKASLRGGDFNADENDKVLFPESLGSEVSQEGRLQEGTRWRRQKAGGRPSRHVENKNPVPLERSCRLIGNQAAPTRF